MEIEDHGFAGSANIVGIKIARKMLVVRAEMENDRMFAIVNELT